jgi:hypothetical protein
MNRDQFTACLKLWGAQGVDNSWFLKFFSEDSTGVEFKIMLNHVNDLATITVRHHMARIHDERIVKFRSLSPMSMSYDAAVQYIHRRLHAKEIPHEHSA